MKVLMPVLHYYPVIGGLETWTQNIAERLSGKAEIFVVTGKVKNQPFREIKNGVKLFRTSLFSLENLSYSSRLYIFTALPFIFLKSLSLVKKEKIELLHCQGFLSSFLGFWLSKLTGVPYIATVQRLESRGNLIKNFVYRKAAVCIGASNAIGENFREIGAKKVEVIPNGIDLKRFENLARPPKDKFVVMTVARLEKVKGIEYLIRALALGQPAELWIIGDGSERKNLLNLAKSLGLGERVNRAHKLCASVKFLGEIPNEKIPGYLAQADCFVLPSLREGFGIAILEAQAAGLPVIGTKVGGIKELIEDGKTGILVEPKNPEAIARAIYEVFSGRRFARADLEKYSWQNIAEKVYKVYKNLAFGENLDFQLRTSPSARTL